LIAAVTSAIAIGTPSACGERSSSSTAWPRLFGRQSGSSPPRRSVRRDHRSRDRSPAGPRVPVAGADRAHPGRLSAEDFRRLEFRGQPARQVRPRPAVAFSPGRPEGSPPPRRHPAGAGALCSRRLLSSRLRRSSPSSSSSMSSSRTRQLHRERPPCTLGKWFFESEAHVAGASDARSLARREHEDVQAQIRLSARVDPEGVGGDRGHDGIDRVLAPPLVTAGYRARADLFIGRTGSNPSCACTLIRRGYRPSR